MSKEKNPCYHCGDDCGSHPILADEKPFCCNGCKSVYEILESSNMQGYYNMDESPGIKPIFSSDSKYKFLESEEIANKLFDFREGNLRRIRIFLPEIHCSSCIWLLENIKQLNAGVLASEVNFLKKEATITFNVEELSFQELATLLDKIGYPPKFDAQGGTDDTKIKRSQLLKLGVTFFCFGNIMLFSAPEYLQIGAEFIAKYRILFTTLVFVFSIPLIVYSAREYLVSAYKALRAKTLNLDVPISIGILALYGRSLYEMYIGNGPGYMDSFAGFLLFLLAGKWFQNKTYQALSFERDYKSYFPMAVTKLVAGEEIVEPLEKVEAKDIILVRNQEIIPTDAILMKGRCNIDYSFVTGESKLTSKQIGDEIFAGGKQVGNAIELQVLKRVEQSYLTQLWNQKTTNTSDSKKENAKSITDRLSHVFIIVVLIAASLAGLVWFFIDPSQVVNIITAVLIVACPCALALSIPFTFGNAMRLAGRNKLYLKNINAIEELGKVTDIVFDKTGTITTNQESKIQFFGEDLSLEDKSIIYSVTRNSSHPLSLSLSVWLKESKVDVFDVNSFKELAGKGIEATVNGRKVRVGSASWTGSAIQEELGSYVYFAFDGVGKGYFLFKNSYRKEFLEIIEPLRIKFKLHLLSGDNEGEKEKLTPYFDELFFNQKPIDKFDYITKLREQDKNVLMLGDGLNDAGALMESDIGLVVSENVYNFSPACDGIIRADKLNLLPKFLDLGKFSYRTLKRSYVFSLLYNLIGLGFAVFNLLTPLVAAILMPISSISVVIFTTLSIRYFGRK